jgi:hypothetical protein
MRLIQHFVGTFVPSRCHVDSFWLIRLFAHGLTTQVSFQNHLITRVKGTSRQKLSSQSGPDLRIDSGPKRVRRPSESSGDKISTSTEHSFYHSCLDYDFYAKMLSA